MPLSPKRNRVSSPDSKADAPSPKSDSRCCSDDDRRTRILDTACKLIQSQGYQHTTMDKIACHAGMSKKTVYLVFPSKRVLMEQLLLERLFTPLSIEPNPEEDIETQLLELVLQMSKHLLDEKCLSLLRAIIGEATRSPIIAHLMEDMFHLSGRKFDTQQWLISQRERGVLQLDDAQDAADHLFGLTLGAPILSRLTYCSPPRTDEQLHRFLREGVRIFLDGCRPHRQ